MYYFEMQPANKKLEDKLKSKFNALFEKFSFLNNNFSFNIRLHTSTKDFERSTKMHGFNACVLGDTIHVDIEESKNRYDKHFDSELVRLLAHEFIHLFTKHLHLPNWIDEGLAEYYSRENISKNDFEKWIPLSKLEKTDFEGIKPTDMRHAYVESTLSIKYLIENYGESKLFELLKQDRDFNKAFASSYNESINDFENKLSKWIKH